ncbi:MAG: hypothetical protein RL235_330 [Chlamydiota bacterium]|jgi:hemolysin activation/secretion protein
MLRYVLPLLLVSCMSAFAAQSKEMSLGDDAFCLRALVVTDQSRLQRNAAEGIVIDIAAPPASPEELQETLSLFIGRTVDAEQIRLIKECVLAFYVSHDHPIVRVWTPEQSLSGGTLIVMVKETKVGKVEYVGNYWTQPDRIEKQLHLEEGQCIECRRLVNDISYVNQDPFCKADVFLTPGVFPGTTDVEVITNDRIPFRPNLGIDNMGSLNIGSNRVFAGFDAGHFFRDHLLTYQYTASDDFRRFQSHTIRYLAPFSPRNAVLLFGGYAQVKPTLSGFESSGWGWQGSFRYNHAIKAGYTGFMQEVSAGCDFKRSNNNLLYVEFSPQQQVIQQNTNLFQAALEYRLALISQNNIFSFSLEGFVSPGQWFADQSNHDYGDVRAHARNLYFYQQMTAKDVLTFGKGWTLHAQLREQMTTATLLPSEEYGLGGFDTVRGYLERITLKDNIFNLNLECHTPPVALFSALRADRKSRRWEDHVEVLAFFDCAFGYDKHRTYPYQKNVSLASFGLGARYELGSYVTARYDWGHRLTTVEGVFNGARNRSHFSCIIVF